MVSPPPTTTTTTHARRTYTDYYTRGALIGRGAFARVFKGWCRATGAPVSSAAYEWGATLAERSQAGRSSLGFGSRLQAGQLWTAMAG